MKPEYSARLNMLKMINTPGKIIIRKLEDLFERYLIIAISGALTIVE